MPAYSEAAYDNDTWALSTDMITHAFFACSTRRAARALRAASPDLAVFIYEFSFELKWPEVALLPDLGNYHTSELDFVFGNDWPSFVHGNFTASERFISDAFQALWTNFVVSGDPNRGPAAAPIAWPAYGGAGGGANSSKSLQIELPLNVVEELHADVCDNAWDPFADALDAAGARAPRALREWRAALAAGRGRPARSP